MGKKEKEHRKKVAARNERLKTERSKFQKTYEAMMKEKFEELAKGFNSLDNVEVVDMIENGESVMETPAEEQ
jgi:predicted nuclease with TOPRIM domain